MIPMVVKECGWLIDISLILREIMFNNFRISEYNFEPEAMECKDTLKVLEGCKELFFIVIPTNTNHIVNVSAVEKDGPS